MVNTVSLNSTTVQGGHVDSEKEFPSLVSLVYIYTYHLGALLMYIKLI